MQIDFDQILASVAPEPATLTYAGTAYALKPLTIVDGATLDAARAVQVGEPAGAQSARIVAALAGLFTSVPVPFLAQPQPTDPGERDAWTRQVLALMATVGALVKDSLDPKAIVAGAMAAATAQIESAGEDVATGSTAGAS